MAEPTTPEQQNPPVKSPDVTAPEAETPPKRSRRKRILKVDKEKVAGEVIARLDQDENDRQGMINRRKARYAKLRGWMTGRDWPWPDCYSSDTEVLTAAGWKLVRDVEVGEYVYTRDQDGHASHRPVAYKSHHDTDKAVHFRGKSIDLIVTENHKMLIDKYGRVELIPAIDLVGLPNKGWKIPLQSKWRGESPKTVYGMPAKAYVRFLGWYISEGSASYQITRYGKSSTGSFAISQSAVASAANCAILDEDLIAAGITSKKYARCYTIHAKSFSPLLRKELRSLGKVDEKYIPNHVMEYGADLLAELLQTLILGDGTTDIKGQSCYSTTSKKLADQVQIIAQRIGLRGTIWTKPAQRGGKIKGRQINGSRTIYTVSINKKPAVQLRKLSVQKITLPKIERFFCVNVPPSHTLYVRRNGKAAWSGNSADFWVPVMLSSCMRLQATLENAVKSTRPLVEAKAVQKRNQPKEDRINKLLDYQAFVENKAEKKIGDDFIANLVQDEAAYAFVHWVREDKTVREIRVLGELDPNVDHIPQFLIFIADKLFTLDVMTEMLDKDGWEWRVSGIDDEDIKASTARVEFYERDDGKIEAVIIAEARTFEGPAFDILDFEDAVFPPRCGSLQPPGPANPHGAPYVNILCRASLDSIVRRYKNGTYDQLDDEDMQAVINGKSSTGTGTVSEESKEQKDRYEGVELSFTNADYSDRTIVMSFRGMDTDGDGLEEEVVLYIERSTGKLLMARYLSELWPGVPQIRPIVNESLFPITNRVIGQGLPEILESVQDASQETIDQHFNWGEITNAPFFFYRASSGLKQERITYEPGEGIPLDDPERDVKFPTWPTRDGTFTINTMSLLQQMGERLAMQSDVSYGRVPTGKSSALRTVGTTMALLGQTDVRSEQILRRLFSAVAQIFAIMHRLNERFLPDKKEFRTIGYPESGEDAYQSVTPDDIKAVVDFEFKATLFNTNKQMLSQSLTEIMTLVLSPLAVQLGIISPEKASTLFRDKIKSLDLDPDRYTDRPPQQFVGPKLLFEEVVSMIIANQIPEGTSLEPPQEHLMKIEKFMASDQLGLLNPTQTVLLQRWAMQIQARMVREQMMMQAVQQFSQGQGGGEGGPGGVPTTMDPNAVNENPPVQAGEKIDESIGMMPQ